MSLSIPIEEFNSMNITMSDTDVDPMKEIRDHWCALLEEALECPVCLLVPSENIFQCVNGHNLCQSCKKMLETCPVCKAAFISTRNRTLEQIAKCFEDIKMSLLDPDVDTKKFRRVEKISISTQTTDGNGVAIVRRSERIAKNANK